MKIPRDFRKVGGGLQRTPAWWLYLLFRKLCLLSFSFLSFLRTSTAHLEVIMAILDQALPAKRLQLYFI